MGFSRRFSKPLTFEASLDFLPLASSLRFFIRRGETDLGWHPPKSATNFETGAKNITFTTLLEVCKVLGKHPSDLLKEI